MLNPASVSKKNLDFIPKVLLRIKEKVAMQTSGKGKEWNKGKEWTKSWDNKGPWSQQWKNKN